MRPADYLADKIQRRLEWYESKARQIDRTYIAQVEKLAARTKDDALARYYRETMDPRRILTSLEKIRLMLQAGEIVKADRAPERLQISLKFVEDHLRHPYFCVGAKVKAGGKKGAKAKQVDPAAMRQMFDAKRASGMSVGDAERAVGRSRTASCWKTTICQEISKPASDGSSITTIIDATTRA